MDSPSSVGKVRPTTTSSPVVNGSFSYTNGHQLKPTSSTTGSTDTSKPVTRQGVEDAFHSFGQLVTASKRPLPTQNGDGTYNDTNRLTGWLPDWKLITWADIKTVIELVKSKLGGDGIVDDKTMLMEQTISIVAKLPGTSKNRVKLTDAFIAELWNSLDHPPQIFVGDKYMYRMADGSCNVSRSLLHMTTIGSPVTDASAEH